MLDFLSPKIVAVMQVAMAVGICRFWINWFGKEHNEPWLPTGYVEHERCFVYPDLVMAFLLTVSAFLLVFGIALGERLSLVCGGLMLFLAVIDTAYFIQNDMLVKERGGGENWGVILSAGLMSFVMIVRFI